MTGTGISGGTLRDWRRSRGWDVPKLARELRRAAGDDPLPVTGESLIAMIRRWERAGMNQSRARSERYELLYCDVFGTTPGQLRRGPSGRTPGGPGAALGAPGSVLDEEARAHMELALADARRYLDPGAVALFRAELEQGKAEDGEHGPARALPRVLGIAAAVTGHARSVKEGTRGILLSLGSEAAEFAGWLYRDLQIPGSAAWWYDRAVEWAQEACNPVMQGYMLVKKSQMHYDARDACRVVTFAEAADDDMWRLPPALRAEAAQQKALGLAMTGEPAPAVERQMAAARSILEHEAAGGGMETLLLRQAACWTEAGKPGLAAGQFADIIGRGTLSRRDTGFFEARRSTALALSGEPDEAAEAGLRAAEVAAQTASARTARILHGTVRALDTWKARPGPRAFREAVTGLESSPSR